MKINLVTCQLHAHLYLAVEVMHGFKSLGHEVEMFTGPHLLPNLDSGLTILFGVYKRFFDYARYAKIRGPIVYWNTEPMPTLYQDPTSTGDNWEMFKTYPFPKYAIFCLCKDQKDWMERIGGYKNVAVEYFPYRHDIVPIPAERVDYDIAFYGVLTERRQVILKELSSKFKCLVNDGMELFNPNKFKQMSRAAICLNLHGAHTSTFETMRVSEALAAGRFMITEHIGEDPVFIDGTHLAICQVDPGHPSIIQALTDLILRYLGDADSRVRIANAGCAMAVPYLSPAAVCTRILAYVRSLGLTEGNP